MYHPSTVAEAATPTTSIASPRPMEWCPPPLWKQSASARVVAMAAKPAFQAPTNAFHLRSL